MSLNYKILGKPGRDNALFINVNSGTLNTKLLFDCGENIFSRLTQHDVKTINHVFFSHFHFDHASGFDYFFRRNYHREETVNVWGPEGTSKFIYNKLNSYTWNLVDELNGRWNIYEFDKKQIKQFHIFAAEGFSILHEDETTNRDLILFNDDNFLVSSVLLDHRINSAAYRVDEKTRFNIDKEKLDELKLTPGPWLELVKDVNHHEEIKIDEKSYNINWLREKLLVLKEGESVVYMTDFIFNDNNFNKAVKLAYGCDTLFCESQYLSKDDELAERNYHLTAKQTAQIAKQTGCKKLVLFHISERYTEAELNLFLEEAREIFEETYLPEGWM